MSTWRRKALDLFPEFKQEIEESDSPTDVWFEVESNLINALKNSDDDFIKSVKQYFSWCVGTNDCSIPHQSATCGFLENIGYRKEYWPYLNILFTTQQFKMYKTTLGYSLSKEKLGEMENAFYGK
jgi:hypothetical protein